MPNNNHGRASTVDEADARSLVGSDPLASEYGWYEKIDHFADCCFWTASLAFAVYVAAYHFGHETAKDGATLSFVVASVLAITASAYARYSACSVADEERIHQLLGDSFGQQSFKGAQAGVDFFTSHLAPGHHRLLANLHQNCFFKVKLLKSAMAPLALLAGAALLIALVSIATRIPKVIELFWVVLLFSEAVGGKFVRLVPMYQAFGRCLKDASALAERYPQTSGQARERANLEILSLFAEYEAIKARYSLRVSINKFDEINASIEAEWRGVARRLGLYELQPGQALAAA